MCKYTQAIKHTCMKNTTILKTTLNIINSGK